MRIAIALVALAIASIVLCNAEDPARTSLNVAREAAAGAPLPASMDAPSASSFEEKDALRDVAERDSGDVYEASIPSGDENAPAEAADDAARPTSSLTTASLLRRLVCARVHTRSCASSYFVYIYVHMCMCFGCGFGVCFEHIPCAGVCLRDSYWHLCSLPSWPIATPLPFVCSHIVSI